MTIQQFMTCKSSLRRFSIKDTQVEEILQLMQTFCRIVDIYLAVTFHSGFIHIVVVRLVVHHLLQVVVVGHADRQVVRIGLAQIGLGIVGQEVAILIPIERIVAWRIVDTVDVAFGIAFVLKQLPATARYLIGSRSHLRFTQTEEVARNDSLRLSDILYSRNTTLKLEMDVHHMALTDRCHVVAIGFFIVILIDNGDNLLLREVEDVRLAADEEGTGLRRSNTVDGEAPLQVGQTTIGAWIGRTSALCDDVAQRNFSSSLGFSSNSSTIYFYITRLRDFLTATKFSNRIALTAEIIRIRSIGQSNLNDFVTLTFSMMSVIYFLGRCRTYSVGRISHNKRNNHHVTLFLIFGIALNWCIIALLVSNLLVFRTDKFVTSSNRIYRYRFCISRRTCMLNLH